MENVAQAVSLRFAVEGKLTVCPAQAVEVCHCHSEVLRRISRHRFLSLCLAIQWRVIEERGFGMTFDTL